MKDIFFTPKRFQRFNASDSFEERLFLIHEEIREDFPFIERIAVILYDNAMDKLTTFIQSSAVKVFSGYTAKMTDAPSLKQMKTSKKTRVVNDLSLFENGSQIHTRRIAAQGYRSSCAVPMFNHETFLGVIFFNAFTCHVFSPDVVSRLSQQVSLINCLVTNQLMMTRMLVGAFRGALDLVSYKDPETGNHLERMARYSKLIAQDLSRKGVAEIDDERIEHLYLFAPLHDIGKIGIPDHILLKPGKLSEGEWEIMQTHSKKGKDIVNAIAEHLGQTSFRYMNMLENIAGSHHETIDGKGYPERLKKEDISIETQIVTVADIFDALTSKRSYKPAWSNEEALKELCTLAGNKLNRNCVTALMDNEEEIVEIQRRFRD